MKPLAWLKKLFGRFKSRSGRDFPSKLETESRGILTAQITELHCNGKLLSRSCRYDSHPAPGKLKARFTVDEESPANPALWKQVFDVRLREFEHNWPIILAQKTPRLETKLKGWLPPDVSIAALIDSLKLELIMVEANGLVRLAFESSAMLQHHVLTVDLSKDNNVKDVSVEG